MQPRTYPQTAPQPPRSALGVWLRPLAQFERGEDWRLTTLHDRKDYLVIWLTKGQGRVILAGQRRGIATHTALMIPPDTLFSMDLMRNSGAQVLTVPADLAVDLALPHRPHLLRLREGQDQAEMTHRLDAIHREQASPLPHASDALKAHIALLSVALRRYLDATDPAPRPSASVRLSEAYCALITQHYASGMGVSEYARMLGVTTPHLTRSCKQAAGLTAAAILSDRALYAARDLIERSDMPISTIAAELQFGTAAYFSRFVTKHTGHAPSSLRKRATHKFT